MSSPATEPALRPSLPAPVPAFRRTAAACQHCQSRKTRCDRKTRGSPCTNCRLDDVDCILGASKTQATAARLGLEKHRRAWLWSSHRAASSTSNAADGFPLPDPLPLQTQTGLPHFIKSLPSHLAAEDREFLRLKGVFEIPGGSARSEILRCYFQFVYPLLPLLDLESFLGPMTGQHNTLDQVSLVLFYAVMCSGAAHVDIQVLQSLGYQSRKTARRAFFERARLLYDFDCEPDQVSLVQAFLLMTYWYDTNKHGRYKDRRFWIREAVTLAQDLDLDLELYDTKSRRLLKRLWWCCFMRDQFVALMTWTPPHFRYGSRRHPALDLSDFELGELSDSVCHEFSEWTLISSNETRIQLATLCIEKAKLCQSINKILHVRYASLRQKSESQVITILVPKFATVDLFEVVEYDRELQKWYQSLPDPRAFDLRDAVASAFVKSSDLITIHRAHLKLLFLSTLIALHRPQVSNRSDTIPVAYQDLSRMKVRDAADEVAHLALGIKNLEMGTHMTPRGVTLFLPILLVHLQDIRPELDGPRGTGLDKYHTCMRILDSIGDTGVPEDSLPVELETAFRKLNILPSHESKIPQSIPLPLPPMPRSEDLVHPRSGGFGILSYLPQLGAINPSEVDLLTDLSNNPIVSTCRNAPTTPSFNDNDVEDSPDWFLELINENAWMTELPEQDGG